MIGRQRRNGEFIAAVAFAVVMTIQPFIASATPQAAVLAFAVFAAVAATFLTATAVATRGTGLAAFALGATGHVIFALSCVLPATGFYRSTTS
jgi:hypothetical protein